MVITYWSDYACPYCYIGEARLKKAIEELGKTGEIKLEMKAFQLDPGAPDKSNGTTLDRFARKYGISKDQAAAQIENISKLGREEGIDFKYATTLFTNTMDAHRLTKFANTKSLSIADRLIEELFKAYFCDNLELADREVLIGAALHAGLDRSETEALLDSDRFFEEVRKDEMDAVRNEIHAVPFFVVGDYGIPGALGTEQMKEVIKKALKDEESRQILPGMSCGPDGCHIG